MKLWIMRHGEAEPLLAGNDMLRALTGRGVQQAHASGEWLRGQGLGDSVPIIASPYRRAQQTAATVAAVLQTGMVETLDLLEPGGDPRRLCHWLGQRQEPALLLVSHMPLVGQLVHWLEEGVMNSGPPFSVAQVCVLEMEMPGAGLARRAGLYVPDWQAP
jgi:phosphohistidine phosphatase